MPYTSINKTLGISFQTNSSLLTPHDITDKADWCQRQADAVKNSYFLLPSFGDRLLVVQALGFVKLLPPQGPGQRQIAH